MKARILVGNVMRRLGELPDESVQCVVTSPPYWGLRDYGTVGQLGLEKTPDEYVAKMVGVFREVRRVLRGDGTLWLNMGDSYASGDRSTYRSGRSDNKGQQVQDDMPRPKTPPGLKPKDLCGIPWMLAFALRADGWWLRQDIIWSKPNPMPESVTDRCTKAHEYLFLLTKSARYYFDAEAIKEECAGDPEASRNRWDTKDYLIPGQKPQKRTSRVKMPDGWDTGAGGHGSFHRNGPEKGETHERETSGRAAGNKTHKTVAEYERSESEEHRTAAGLLKIADVAYPVRNKRSVWEIATQPYSEAHFATFPEKLVEPCILAGSREGDTVLDPFCGSGTTGAVALRYQRDFVGIELNPEYAKLAYKRIGNEAPMFNQVNVVNFQVAPALPDQPRSSLRSEPEPAS